jgi:uncharacterized protein (TIGR02996 family)
VTKADDLIAQIHTDPLDDTSRTVYADLLEERGDERGRLIHLQLKRAALPGWDPQVTELELQERALLAKHGAAWRAALPTLPGVTWGSFTRGFVGKVAFDSLGAYAEYREACRAATPVHSIVLRWPREAKPKKLDAVPGIDEITFVGTVMRKEDLKWLAGCPLLAAVRSLNLIDSELRTGLPDLLKSPHLAKLAALRIPLHQLGNTGVTRLTAASLPALTELDLSVGTEEDDQVSSYGRTRSNTLGERGALALAAWAGLAQVAALDVSGARLGRQALTALLASQYTKSLKRLYVRAVADAQWEMDDSLAAFETGPGGSLDELDIGSNDLDGDAALAMMQSRALQQLKILRLTPVRSKHFDRIAQAPWIHSLRILSCGETALELIVKRSPRQLHTIRVVAEGSAAHGVAKKLTAAPLPALTSLDLSASRITDPSLRVLGAVDTLPNLVSVKLAPPSGAKATFTAEGAAEFANSPLGKRLTSLHTGIAEIDRLPPQPEIDVGDGDYSGPFRFL